eukprot:1397312-Heterocapsa_arctica.AAC.1
MDFRWKGAMTRHGISSTCENTTKITTPGAEGPWGAAGGGAVLLFVLLSRRLGRPCARNPMSCRRT